MENEYKEIFAEMRELEEKYLQELLSKPITQMSAVECDIVVNYLKTH